MNWFRENEGEASDGLDLTRYFIIFVGGGSKVNTWHHDWDSNNIANKHTATNFENKYSTASAILDRLTINGEETQDWNTNSGRTELFLWCHKS